MLRKLRARLTYANVMATIAVFIALATGGAYASHLVVNSSDVVNESLLSEDIKNGSLTGADVANSSIQGVDVGSTLSGPNVVDGGLTGDDIFPDSLRGVHIEDSSLTTDDVQNFSLGNGDFLTGSVNSRVATNASLTGTDVANNSLTGADITNRSLKDEDIGESTFVNFSANIGSVAAHSCEYKRVTGVNALGDHLLLTPNMDTEVNGLVYQARYASTTEDMWIKVCNVADGTINDGSTNFNLLVINAR